MSSGTCSYSVQQNLTKRNRKKQANKKDIEYAQQQKQLCICSFDENVPKNSQLDTALTIYQRLQDSIQNSLHLVKFQLSGYTRTTPFSLTQEKKNPDI